MPVQIVPRDQRFYESLVDLFKATFQHTGYPVHGPPSSDRTTWLTYFTSTSAMSEVLGLVAIGKSNDECLSSDRIDMAEGQVLGHVSICEPQADEITAKLASEPYSVPQDRLWKISRLAVHPNAQGQGVAKLLMDRVESEAANAGKILILGVLAEKDVVAQKMYEKRGYINFGTNEITGLNNRIWVQTFYVQQ